MLVCLNKVIVEQKPPYSMHQFMLEMHIEFVCQCFSIDFDVGILKVIR